MEASPPLMRNNKRNVALGASRGAAASARGDGVSHVGRGRKWLRLVRGVLQFAHARRRVGGVFTQSTGRGEIATRGEWLRVEGQVVKERRR